MAIDIWVLIKIVIGLTKAWINQPSTKSVYQNIDLWRVLTFVFVDLQDKMDGFVVVHLFGWWLKVGMVLSPLSTECVLSYAGRVLGVIVVFVCVCACLCVRCCGLWSVKMRQMCVDWSGQYRWVTVKLFKNLAGSWTHKLWGYNNLLRWIAFKEFWRYSKENTRVIKHIVHTIGAVTESHKNVVNLIVKRLKYMWPSTAKSGISRKITFWVKGTM